MSLNTFCSTNTKTEEKSQTKNIFFIYIQKKSIRDKLIRRKNSLKKEKIKFYLKKKRKYFLALIQDSELFSSSNKTGAKIASSEIGRKILFFLVRGFNLFFPRELLIQNV